MKKRIINVRVDEETAKMIDELRLKHSINVSALVRQLLSEKLTGGNNI